MKSCSLFSPPALEFLRALCSSNHCCTTRSSFSVALFMAFSWPPKSSHLKNGNPSATTNLPLSFMSLIKVRTLDSRTCRRSVICWSESNLWVRIFCVWRQYGLYGLKATTA
ncbi:uncharacterized protein LOC116192474 [Punica granatum]|uniref:Uncharacterized protein LOC116190449 n=1 Tax=Punica granatum TaxID=22663 RepID=A0A6P8C0C5_PUNGR|nr:uncharacterized protein LOC116190449 [Punica granatum]XP_031376892.1 uncharacterized protein LOC116192474 [Punica granatum]